jgi:branched-chain amino acid aminotransferase
VVLNDKGNVCDGLNSNVFVVVNGVIYTPSVHEACIEGVMRKKLIELCGIAGMKVYETELRPNDLIRADEVFFSNAIQGVSWIGAYKSKRYFNSVSKKIIDLLNQSVTVSSEMGLQGS